MIGFTRLVRTAAVLSTALALCGAALAQSASGSSDTATVPLKFKEGDVISAHVINQLFGRINDVTTGFQDPSELDGSWTCTTYQRPLPGETYDACEPDGPILLSKIGQFQFDASAMRFTYTGDGDPRSCYLTANDTYIKEGNFDVKGGLLITDYGVFSARKQGANSFVWMIAGSSPPREFTSCERDDIPPGPAGNLSLAVAAGAVTLTWDHPGDGVTGFTVQRKDAVTGTWTDLVDVAGTARSHIDSPGSSGEYWYRVFAFNSHGDSISSSEVRGAIESVGQ